MYAFVHLLTRLVISCENCSHYITNPRSKKTEKGRESNRAAYVKGDQNQNNQVHVLTTTITVNIYAQSAKNAQELQCCQ